MEIKSLWELVENENRDGKIIEIRSLDGLYESGEITGEFYSRLKKIEQVLNKKRGYEKSVNLESYLLQEYQFYERTVKDLSGELEINNICLSRLMRKMNLPLRNRGETAKLSGQREKFSEAKKGKYNPMYNVPGEKHPCYGRKAASVEERIKRSLRRLPEGIVLPTKDELYNLRINKKLTKDKIGRIYNVSSCCINTWMEIYGILDVSLPRGCSKADIPKKTLERLAKTMPVSQIADYFNVTVSTIYRRLDWDGIQRIKTDEAQRLTRQINRQKAKDLLEFYLKEASYIQ